MSSLVEEGLRHHNAGDLEKAEQCYLDAVSANSSDAQALKLLGVMQNHYTFGQPGIQESCFKVKEVW